MLNRARLLPLLRLLAHQIQVSALRVAQFVLFALIATNSTRTTDFKGLSGSLPISSLSPYILGNILRSTRYGAISSRIGKVQNRIVGIVLSDCEMVSNWEWTQATYDALRGDADEPDFPLHMDTVREKTLTWLGRHVSPCFKWAEESLTLRMRPAGDFTPDDQLKESWLHAMSPEDRARLVMVFDDRDRVVSMWRRNGVVCAQVAEGDF